MEQEKRNVKKMILVTGISVFMLGVIWFNKETIIEFYEGKPTDMSGISPITKEELASYLKVMKREGYKEGQEDYEQKKERKANYADESKYLMYHDTPEQDLKRAYNRYYEKGYKNAQKKSQK